MIQAVLFDLDGTLADTAPDLGGALNTLLRRHGLAEKSLAQIRPVAGHGAGGLVKLGAGIGAEDPQYESWRAAYLDEYERRADRDTALFPQIAELLAELHRRRIRWGIVTNKHAHFTGRLVERLAFAVPPQTVVSGDTCPKPKPSAEPMLYACGQIGIAPQHCLYVGDAERDMQAGKNAGMKTVLAMWGYLAPEDQPESWPADFTVYSPLEIVGLLDGGR